MCAYCFFYFQTAVSPSDGFYSFEVGLRRVCTARMGPRCHTVSTDVGESASTGLLGTEDRRVKTHNAVAMQMEPRGLFAF